MTFDISKSQHKLDIEKHNLNKYICQVDNVVTSLLKKYCVPGAAISIIDNGQAVLVREYGLSDRKNKKRVEIDTCFQVASISKTLTAWGIMKLIESGMLGLEDSVEKYLRRWKIPNSSYTHDEVTIRRVLSHTGGFSVDGYTGVTKKEKVCTLEESLLSPRNKLMIVNEPGKKFQYSGGGYTLLQLLIEEVTGMSYSKYMRDEILTPLGMNNSTFDLEDGLEYKVSNAHGIFGWQLPRYYFTELAAAGMYTTIEDMTKFIEANVIGNKGELPGRGVLSPESISLMHKRVNRVVPYGLGYYVRNLPGGYKIVAHGGKNKGWNAQFAMFPKQRNGLIVVTNSVNGGGVISELFKLWIESIIGVIPEFYMKVMEMDRSNRFVSLAKDITLMLKLRNFIR